MVMNDILGGGGFTARLMKRVRSDEGSPTASIRSSASELSGRGSSRSASPRRTRPSLSRPGSFSKRWRRSAPAWFRKRNSGSRRALSSTLFRALSSRPSATARTFAADEVIGRPHSYWTEYRRRIEAVTADDVRAAAAKHLDSGKLAMLVVGKWSEIEPGDADGRAKMADLFGGAVEHLPLRDPLTLLPLAE